MKILITILLALFISSQAYSKSEGVLSACLFLDSEIASYISSIKLYKGIIKEQVNKVDWDREQVKKIEELHDHFYARLQKSTTEWQKLSCTELLK
jgi:hypothetical protein